MAENGGVSASPVSARDPGPTPIRERLLGCAAQLFYAEGIRAVSADRIIAEVGTTKATFYRHFPTKDDLVLAYLEQQAAQEQESMALAAAPADPAQALHSVLDSLARSSCAPGFRGCPFINAAAEYPDAQHPVRVFAAQHRDWWVQFFAELARRNGHPEAEAGVLARQLMMLRDGLTVAGSLDAPTDLAPMLHQMVGALLAGR